MLAVPKRATVQFIGGSMMLFPLQGASSLRFGRICTQKWHFLTVISGFGMLNAHRLRNTPLFAQVDGPKMQPRIIRHSKNPDNRQKMPSKREKAPGNVRPSALNLPDSRRGCHAVHGARVRRHIQAPLSHGAAFRCRCICSLPL